MARRITVLLVMTRERRAALLEQLEACGTNVLAACDCNEASQILKAKPPVQVVISDASLPGANWRDVLELVAASNTHAEVIVCTRFPDTTLWIDALERGAYDLLVEPYQKEEVQRILEAAADRSYIRSLPPARAGARNSKLASGAGAG